MKISLNWLQKYIDIHLTVDELVEVLNQIGIEVESVESVGLKRQDTLVVGEVLDIKQHPNADKLSVCHVDVGDGEIKQIVCGAKNFKLNDKVPVALNGTILPGDFAISETMMRGVKSEGMMCSGREMGTGNDHSGLLILPEDTPVGASVCDVLGLQGDYVLDLSITANRGDYLSYIGIARALAAKLKINFTVPNVKNFVSCHAKTSANNFIKELNVSSKTTPYYTAWSVQNVKVSDSPEWLQRALRTSGLRSINNVVDITNFVMLETGQPLHALDADKITGGKLVVRQAKDNETIKTLDGNMHVLNEQVTVIADVDNPLVIAGIIGGIAAEINCETKNVVLESAYFEHASVRKTSRSLGIATDSSYRFVRDVDPDGVKFAAFRALEMLCEICGGEVVSDGLEVGEKPRGSVSIELDSEFLSSYTGLRVDFQEAQDIFKRLGFDVDVSAKDWIVTVPTFRSDVTRNVDLVEEFLQIHGTADIPDTVISANLSHRDHDKIPVFSKRAGDYLCDLGFFECYNYSLRSSAEIEKFTSKPRVQFALVDNPLLADQDYYRFSVIPGLIDTLKLNVQNGNSDGKFFEIGRVVAQTQNKFFECLAIGFAVLAEDLEKKWRVPEPIDFYDVKAILLQLIEQCVGKRAINSIQINDEKMWQSGYAASFGDIFNVGIDAKCGLLSLDITRALDIKQPVYAGELLINLSVFDRKKSKATYKPFSQFPRSTKDIAIIVDEAENAGTVQSFLEKISAQTVSGQIFIENIKLFDVFHGKGLPENKKSLAFAINYRSNERTLTDKEVQTSFELIQNKISEKYDIRKL